MSKIPAKYQDLRRHVFVTDLKKICFFIGWMVLFVGSALLYNYNHQTWDDERRIVGWKLVIWIAASAIIGFFLFRMWTFFTDRTYVATVHFAELSHSYTPANEPYGIKALSYDFRTNTCLRVKIKNKIKRRRLHFEQKIGSYWYYADGQRIIHFHGLPYPLNLDPDAKQGYICVACGRMHGELRDECEYCFLSLIDPKDMTHIK